MSRHRPPATGAAEAPGVGPVLGWVAGEPVPRAELDGRLAALRRGPRAATLPQPGSAEDRQLARWVTQVILTERLCEHEARHRRMPTVDSQPRQLDRRAAVELGSITAAAYGGNAAVRAMYGVIAADIPTPAPTPPAVTSEAPPRYRLRHGLYADETSARLAVASPESLAPMGDVRLDELPRALSVALTDAASGDLVGPLSSRLGWHVALVDEVLPPADPTTDIASADLHAAAARRAFAHWLDERRAELLDLVPGLEHPGDPRQPDNHHRH